VISVAVVMIWTVGFALAGFACGYLMGRYDAEAGQKG
jgi:hypothetical protein